MHGAVRASAAVFALSISGWSAGDQFWLYTLYDKDTIDDLSAKERGELKDMLKRELSARRKA